LDVNRAKLGVENPQRRYTEKRPFDSWDELYALAERLGPRHGPMVLFAAATVLRPGEGLALEHRDIDREAQVVYVRRTFRNGRIKTPKTKASVRAVPLQATALAALDELRQRAPECPLLFASATGGYFDLHSFRNRNWRPAQKAAGIEPLRRVYDLRHTFATFALRAGISTFDLSRYMGTSLAMIDRHYGHLARDGREHAIRLLDTYRAAAPLDVHAVDARWTLNDVSDASVDNGKGGEQEQRGKPSDGLEPSTPLLTNEWRFHMALSLQFGPFARLEDRVPEPPRVAPADPAPVPRTCPRESAPQDARAAVLARVRPTSPRTEHVLERATGRVYAEAVSGLLARSSASLIVSRRPASVARVTSWAESAARAPSTYSRPGFSSE
jgi:hypothetical protein